MHEPRSTVVQAPGAPTDAESHVIDGGTLTLSASDPSPMLKASISCVVEAAPTATVTGTRALGQASRPTHARDRQVACVPWASWPALSLRSSSLQFQRLTMGFE